MVVVLVIAVIMMVVMMVIILVLVMVLCCMHYVFSTLFVALSCHSVTTWDIIIFKTTVDKLWDRFLYAKLNVILIGNENFEGVCNGVTWFTRLHEHVKKISAITIYFRWFPAGIVMCACVVYVTVLHYYAITWPLDPLNGLSSTLFTIIYIE